DLVATRDRIVDLRAPHVSCLALIDDIPDDYPTDGHDRYWLCPPPPLRFLALQPISANLKIRLAPAPDGTTLPVDFFLTDDQGHISQGEIRGATAEVRRINLPRGLSDLELSVKVRRSDRNAGLSFPVLAEL